MPTLVLTPGCAARGRVGPVAWVVFEVLALAAEHDDAGWIAPLGVRDLAAALGMNKDTAARAVAALTTAGLVARERLGELNATRRSGYRLMLPVGTELCPARPDTAMRPPSSDTTACPTEADTEQCPERTDSDRCPAGPDTPPGPSISDAELCPGAPDAAMPGTSSRHLSPDGRQGLAIPPNSRQEPAQADSATVVAPGDSGPPVIPEDDSERAGPVRALSGHVSGGAQQRQPRKGRGSLAQNEAQGLLFDLAPAASGDLEDQPR